MTQAFWQQARHCTGRAQICNVHTQAKKLDYIDSFSQASQSSEESQAGRLIVEANASSSGSSGGASEEPCWPESLYCEPACKTKLLTVAAAAGP